MQQVGRQHFTQRVAAVDPHLLPVPLRPARLPARTRPLVGLSHAWVLHRRRLLRALFALILCGIAVAAYVMREDIALAGEAVGGWVDERLVDAGFGIETISISGQAITAEITILRALGITDATPIFAIDAAWARAQLEALPSVESATVRKVYPNEIIIELTEPVPVARWRLGGDMRLVDAWGNPIARALPDDGMLPLVIGEGAAEQAQPMIHLMARYPELNADLAALARIGERRWDLLYYSGLRVYLPETGVAAALAQLAQYQRDYRLLDRDVSLIDLRLSGAVAVLPTEREED